MQPEQNQSLPPVNPTPFVPPPEPSQPKRGMPKWAWFVIGGVIILLAGFVYLIVSLLAPPGASENKEQSNQLTKLTIGEQLYVYPCSVATEADYARIFKLDAQNVGTVEETSALLPEAITADTSDLTKIAPASGDRYDTDCSYTLAKTGATRMNRIDIKLVQFASEEKAETSYKSSRASDAGDYTSDGVDNGTRQLSKLPSFPESSYVRLPDADSTFPGLEATYLSGSRIVTLEYNFGPSETSDTTLPLLDEYAKAIQSKLNVYKEGKPTDLTDRMTSVGKKFVDLCQRTDISKLGSAFGSLEFRPDEMRDVNTYGSLEGSSAAEDGAVSDCTHEFSTSGDREAQGGLSESSRSRLEANKRWPHTLSLRANTMRDSQEAKALLAAKKARAANVLPNSDAPVIEDVTGLGDGAFTVHQESTLETTYNAEKIQTVFIEDTLVVVSGSDVITVSLHQISDSKSYKTAPIEVSEAQQKKAYALVRDTLAQNRE